MEKVLYAADELTGLIYPVSLMSPSKSVRDMEVKSLTNRHEKTPDKALQSLYQVFFSNHAVIMISKKPLNAVHPHAQQSSAALCPHTSGA